MTTFGYRAAEELVRLETAFQMERAEELARLDKKGDPFNEVLHIPTLLAPVGVGKTAIIREISTAYNLPLYKVNSGECGDPTDLSGTPIPSMVQKTKSGSYVEWVLNKVMHEACIKPVILAFDDVDKAPPLVQGALIGILGERKVRDRMLHPGTIIIAAGNRATDDSLAQDLSESIRTRATIIFMEANMTDFEYYGRQNPDKVHPALLGFLAYNPNLLHRHDPDAPSFPCPRRWCEATPYLNKYADTDKLEEGRNTWRIMLELKVGEPAAVDFDAWYQIVRKVDIKRILSLGTLDYTLDDKAKMVDYAAVFALSSYINKSQLTKHDTGLVKYLGGLQPEHRVALLSQLSTKAKQHTARTLPDTADMLLKDLVPVATT